MKRYDQTSISNHTWNALNKGLFNMDTIAWLTTIYVAIYLGVIINDNASKEPPKEPPKVEQTK
jgi:hypothetical protein